MLDKMSISFLTDEELFSLKNTVDIEIQKRRKENTRFIKASLAKTNKKNTLCPYCGGASIKDGKRKDGIQNYECASCHRKYSDSVSTSLASSKLDHDKIKEIITLICLDCPDWVISTICKVNIKTAQYWVDRCLNSSMEWASNNTLTNKVFIDEMQFAPIRSKNKGFVTYAGKLAKNLYLEYLRIMLCALIS